MNKDAELLLIIKTRRCEKGMAEEVVVGGSHDMIHGVRRAMQTFGNRWITQYGL